VVFAVVASGLGGCGKEGVRNGFSLNGVGEGVIFV